MEASSSSKVTVEYHDPSGVFPLVSRDIAARLPLRNLNWQTPSRPLRQIRQLHVEFVADNFTETTLRLPVQRVDSNGPNSFDIVRSGKDQRKDAVKERRHQIPGLKTSPYLKIYVLRCDDKDTYKGTERKHIREWIQENVQSKGKRGENHDAFEWLILHVVIPDTVAASEPRWRESQKEPDELKERKTSNVKFPGKSSRTVFDRLRADFNESTKTGQDRVSQIRLQKNEVPPDLLPTPAVAETLTETAQERELTWKDLTDKFKAMLLASFDTRVRQYESDIAEQESRRSLPGWNFCTFFIHKEGLAKALESIGLVEDALVIYDELSLGLETVVRDIASGQAEGTATTFATHTEDIETRILEKAGTVVNGTNGVDNHAITRSQLFSKDYRERIVRSDISVFDFLCYLFSRQKALILRLANTRASRAELSGRSAGDGGEDLVLVSEVCWRASSFIHNNARTLRQDLSQQPKSSDRSRSSADVEALVCSWTYAVAEQILAETSVPALELAQPESKEKFVPNGASGPNRSDFSFAMGASPYPQRNSSLAIRKSAPELPRPPVQVRDSLSSPPSSSGTDMASKGAGVPGLPELVTYRAELVMMQRKMLEQLAERKGWRAGWASFKHAKAISLQDVDLDATKKITETSGKAESATKDSAVSASLPPLLAKSLESESAFYSAYQRLSDQAMRFYALATQTKSVEVIVGDLAMLKHQQGDFATAEDYLKHLLPSYASDGWSSMEAEVLSIYAECLKKVDRKEQYVKTVLSLLAKVCGRQMAQKLALGRSLGEPSSSGDEVDVSGLLAEAVSISRSLSSETTVTLEHYFSEVELEPDVMHLDDRDGFALRLRFRHLLDDDIEVDQISAHLISMDDPAHDLWLVSDGAVAITPGQVELDLETTVTAFGAFSADTLVVKAGKLRFAKDFKPKAQPQLLLNDDVLPGAPLPAEAHKQPAILLYPAEHAFNTDVELAKDVRIDKPRHIFVTLNSGWNEIENVNLKVRPTSGGLRLHLADATYQGIAQDIHAIDRPGQLSAGSLEMYESAVISIPYTVEQATPDISMRFEFRYHTPKGSFTRLSSVVLRHELPLDVDVHDAFHLEILSSNFTIRTTRNAPLAVIRSELQDSPVYAVEGQALPDPPMFVYESSPVKFTYKITRKDATEQKISRRDAALSLGLRYIPLDELLVATMCDQFIAGLEADRFKALSRLLLPLLTERSRQYFQSKNLSIAITLNESQLPSFEDFGWDEVIRMLPALVRPELTEWLHQWHREHPRCSIDYGSDLAQKVLRSLNIAVEVPTIDAMFSASMNLQASGVLSAPGAQVLTLGKPVNAELHIRHSKAWSARAILGNGGKASTDKVSFIVDIQADPEVWLVGGPRKAHIALTDQEPTIFNIMLVPLKPGSHPLPAVDVQQEPEVDAETGTQKASQPVVSCETHYESGGKTVEVIRDIRTTRIHVMESSAPITQEPTPSTGTRSVTEPG